MTHGPDLYSSESDKFDWLQIVLTDVLLNNRFIRGAYHRSRGLIGCSAPAEVFLIHCGALRRLGSKIMKKKLEITGKKYRC